MIFKTQKLDELRNLQNSKKSDHLKALTKHIIKQVWPQKNTNSFCQTIQSIALKWMNEFVNLIQHWLTQSSQKYILKMYQYIKASSKSQQTSTTQEYILNLSKCVQSMQYPMLTSMNNLSKLYLKYPQDQTIQQPRKPTISNINSPQKIQNKKKKSLSIQSFASNIPTRSRSTSKGRKLSFFNNTAKSNIMSTFSKQFKNKDSLNTTVKKVKKEMQFTKQSSTMSQTLQERFGPNQKYQLKPRSSNVNDLKEKLEQRLSHTCSSTFFNQLVLEKGPSKPICFENDQKQDEKVKYNLINQASTPQAQRENSTVNFQDQKSIKNMQQVLKNSILQQIQQNDKKNYEQLVKNFESKLNDKFDTLLDKILKQNKRPQTITQKQDPAQQISTIISTKKIDDLKVKQTSNENSNYLNEYQSSSVTPTTKKQEEPSINNLMNQNKQTNCLNDFQIQQVKLKQRKRQSRINSSSIVQNDASKIIRSKKQNNPIPNLISKEKISSPVQKKNIQIKTNPTSPIKYPSNPIQMQDSIDSIEIIDEAKQHRNSIQVNKISPSPKLKDEKDAKTTDDKKQQPVKKQDNFYMKRIKQLKFNMETCLKGYKTICDKINVPVNQTFLILFSISYQGFCRINSLMMSSQQVTDVFSKYKSESDMKKKLPENQESFLVDSLGKIQKMLKLKCEPEKKAKFQEYASKCVACIETVYFEKPDLQLKDESAILAKLNEIKNSLKPTASK